MKKLIKSAVPENILNLLYTIMQEQRFKRFYLVGGTSLALRIGHRVSVDIDLFIHEDFDVDFVGELLVKEFSANKIERETNTVRGFVSDIKVDLIAHKYQLLEPIERIDGIRMAGLKDIAAMKINAISKRGAKKDFWDYAALLSHFTTEEMLSFFQTKYPAANVWHAEKSLSFFDDSEKDPDPKDLSGRTWREVKQIVSRSLQM